MAKKKKDKEAKKARTAEKHQKAQLKSESKSKKLAKKLNDEDEDDVDIDEILENFAKQQEEFETITTTNCDRPSKRINPTLIASPVHGKRELLLFGGEATVNSLAVFYNELYSYSPDTDQWKKVSSPNSPLPRSGHAMCVHPSGLILMFGGEFSSPKQNTFYHYGDTWILDPVKKEWSRVESKKGPSARSGHRLTYWKNYVLLHGGFKDLSSSTSYLSDLWAFDVTSYKWHQVEFPPNQLVPDARSGHSLMPCTEGAILWGGYSKVKAQRNKTVQKGKGHVDTWFLKMKADLKGVRWERRKKSGFAPSARVGCSMVHHKGRGVLFGGVYDTEETEESLESEFYNNLFAYQIEANRWFSLTLRQARKKKMQAPVRQDRDKDLEATLSEIFKDNLKVEEEYVKSEESESNDEELVVKQYPVVNTLPHPRFNSSCAVVDDTLFIYGGVWENGDREFVLDSMYSLDLGKLDGLKVYWEDLRELEEAGDEDEEDEDEDEEEEDEENEEEEEVENDEAMEIEEEELEEEIEEETKEEEIKDPRPWLPVPKPFETLRAFYQRTSAQFMEWALSANNESRGKDLKREAFEMSEDRWWECREQVRVAEDQYEELGGVGEIIERDSTQKKTRR